VDQVYVGSTPTFHTGAVFVFPNYLLEREYIMVRKALYGSKKKYHYLYKTVNKVNGCYYYGMHSTNNLEDGYLGSGTYLKRSMNKYGKQNFELQILKYFNTRRELVEAEKVLITEKILQDKRTYNLVEGGQGFCTGSSLKANIRRKELLKENKEWKRNYSEKLSTSIKAVKEKLTDKQREEIGKKVREGLKKVNFNHATFKGKKHSEKSKKKISESKKGKDKGLNNSQYGTCWITNEKQNKKIKKGDPIPKGWRLGRVINNYLPL